MRNLAGRGFAPGASAMGGSCRSSLGSHSKLAIGQAAEVARRTAKYMEYRWVAGEGVILA